MLLRTRFALVSSLCLALTACGTTAAPTPSSAAPKPAASASASAKPAGSPEVAKLTRVGGFLTATVDALKKNDVAAAKKSFADFDDGWNAIEV